MLGTNMVAASQVLTTLDKWIEATNNFLWGIPLMLLILPGGIYLTIKLGLLQVKKLPLALKWMVKNGEGGEGEVTSFAALCTALSATLGTGNIIGVATAISLGGPGALFWMVVAAFFGMATKYAEGLLAVKYRVVDKDNHSLGGPFYYIEKGMGVQWKWMAKLFAFFGTCVGLLGIGTFTQVNGISRAVQEFFDPNKKNTVKIAGLGEYSWAVIIVSFIIAVCVALVLIGGIKKIASVSEVVVPFMAVLYIGCCLILIVCNITEVPNAIKTIVIAAFSPKAVAGGIAGSLFEAMRRGIERGIFSNEAGLGSAPIAAAAARTKEPVRQGLVSMTGTFIDTICICSMTGLAIVLTGAWKQKGLESIEITSYAFQNGLPFPAKVSIFLLMCCLVIFAFTTILGWDYYSERCLEYFTDGNHKIIMIYRWCYILAVFIGPYMTVDAVWNIAGVFNALMALPNMIALLVLSGVVSKETKSFLKRLKNGEIET